ncbi:Pericentriolar Material 1 Protein [Manis pentadactyla]|nr:Pericentriolar Material 1 Protein [Manis pentadactyla]
MPPMVIGTQEVELELSQVMTVTLEMCTQHESCRGASAATALLHVCTLSLRTAHLTTAGPHPRSSVPQVLGSIPCPSVGEG